MLITGALSAPGRASGFGVMQVVVDVGRQKKNNQDVNLSRCKSGSKRQPPTTTTTTTSGTRWKRTTTERRRWEESIYLEESPRALDGPLSFYWFHRVQIGNGESYR